MHDLYLREDVSCIVILVLFYNIYSIFRMAFIQQRILILLKFHFMFNFVNWNN